MICQKCKVREATITITKQINNMQITMHLCPQCSKHFSTGLQKKISGVNNILMRMMGVQDSVDNESDTDNPVCPGCGMAFEEFKKKGTIGCEQCYVVYRDRFQSILRKLHGDFRHKGLNYDSMASEKGDMQEDGLKMPAVADRLETVPEESMAEKIDSLKKALCEAIAREEYEEAAKIRDMIKIMEDKPTGGEDT